MGSKMGGDPSPHLTKQAEKSAAKKKADAKAKRAQPVRKKSEVK